MLFEGIEFSIFVDQYNSVTSFGVEYKIHFHLFLSCGFTGWNNGPKSLQVFSALYPSYEFLQEDINIDEEGNKVGSGSHSFHHSCHS